ncbi:beta-lactamase-like protein [Syncephalis plumigaleata]|nr:beta-lactamase-like protein [Syncephalis plumigaleata]
MGGGHRLLGLKKRFSTLRTSPSLTTISTIDTVSSSATLSSSIMGGALDSNSINRLSMSLTDDQANSLHTTTMHSMSSQLSGYGSIASLDVDPYASLSGGNAQFRAAAPDRHIYRLVCRANEQFHRKRYRPALSEYSKAIRLAMDANRSNGIRYSSANLTIHEKLAELTRQGGETADFIALLYANRSASHCMLNNYEEARADAEIAIRIRSDWGKGFYRKGEALLGLRQYEEALQCYEECLQRDPTNPDARVGMSNAKVKLEDQQSGLFTRQLLAGPMRNFIYLIADRDTRDCVIVDACWDVPGLLDIIKQEGLNLVGAIVTHHHFDHVGGAPPPPFDQFRIRVSGLATILKKKPAVTAYVHPLDVPELVPANPGLPLSRIRPTPDGYVLKLGRRTTIRFLHTPGHTPGSQCLLVNERRLFTGDTLFLGCCGRLDMPGGNPEAMWRSLRRLANLDDQLVIYPGHEYGGEWSTLQEEKMAGALKDCTLTEWLKQQEERRHGRHNHDHDDNDDNDVVIDNDDTTNINEKNVDHERIVVSCRHFHWHHLLHPYLHP